MFRLQQALKLHPSLGRTTEQIKEESSAFEEQKYCDGAQRDNTNDSQKVNYDQAMAFFHEYFLEQEDKELAE